MRLQYATIAFAGLTLAFTAAAMPRIDAQAQSAPQVNPPGAAQPNDISSASSKHSSNSVFVGGTPIMRVRFASSGYTPEQRAAAIQERVNRLLSDGPIRPGDVTVRDVDPTDSAVYVKGELLFTADGATAHANQTDPHSLAEKWAATMRSVLPSLTRQN